MIKVGIIGGTGYTGVELLRLLAQHPRWRSTSSPRAGRDARFLPSAVSVRGGADDRAIIIS
ncbi:MAG TPA: hypothetical protein VJ437_10370 [Acidiferrobacterales bacterium]|nr:hypothetical protein [Acidiferrobacterales bacterium]